MFIYHFKAEPTPSTRFFLGSFLLHFLLKRLFKNPKQVSHLKLPDVWIIHGVKPSDLFLKKKKESQQLKWSTWVKRNFSVQLNLLQVPKEFSLFYLKCLLFFFGAVSNIYLTCVYLPSTLHFKPILFNFLNCKQSWMEPIFKEYSFH